MTIKLSLPTGENISQQGREWSVPGAVFPISIILCDPAPLSTPALMKSKKGVSCKYSGEYGTVPYLHIWCLSELFFFFIFFSFASNNTDSPEDGVFMGRRER